MKVQGFWVQDLGFRGWQVLGTDATMWFRVYSLRHVWSLEGRYCEGDIGPEVRSLGRVLRRMYKFGASWVKVWASGFGVGFRVFVKGSKILRVSRTHVC